ncbi:MAG: beta-eliminating lyase-related protein, partial [Acidimicrobiales bacterium]
MTNGFVDLRSDTVTRPTDAMRKAMSEAEVGDDVYGEDPTVSRLEERFAARVGKQAAIYVPSGTMANQLAVRVLSRRATSVIAGRRQHVVAFEDGAAAENSGVQFHTVPDEDGTISPASIRWA